MGAIIDLTGERFGRWTVVERAGSTVHKSPLWRVRCDCGAVVVRLGSKLRNGESKSCGCAVKVDIASRTEKRCAKCGASKSCGEFRACKRNGDGLQTYCKECQGSIRAVYVSGPGGAKVAARSADRWRERRERVLAHYGGRCACCGEAEFQFLAIDHVEGGGAKHRASDVGAAGIAAWLIKHGMPGGFRVLCHNCNMARGVYGYCPHEREARVAS